ncbi:MAG: ester cyclase [Nitriliruptoraceae bacterium]
MDDEPAGLVRWLFAAAWSDGETGSLPERVGAVTFHYGGSARETDGRALQDLITAYREAFPDLRFVVEDLVERGDRVAVRCRFTGTHRGRWRGFEPTGRTVDFDVAMFFRFEGGRLVEVWEVDDAARRDRQLGLT